MQAAPVQLVHGHLLTSMSVCRAASSLEFTLLQAELTGTERESVVWV